MKMKAASYTKAWDLTTIPDAVLKSEWARRTQAKRKTRAGGRPKKETACPKCGVVLGAREMRAHGC